jgi:hypothetical protein
MIYASPEPICFYEVKAHSDNAGNKCADAIAKHSALHDGCHGMHFQPPAPDGNAYTHLFWLATKDTDENPSGRGATTPRLRALSDLNKGQAENRIVQITQTGQCQNRHRVLQLLEGTSDCWSLNKPAINAFWHNSNFKLYKKRNEVHIGTIFNKKHAYRYVFSPNANCPICPVHQ